MKKLVLLICLIHLFAPSQVDCQNFTFPLANYGANQLKYVWLNAIAKDINQLCFQQSTFNPQYSIQVFDLLFCSQTVPTSKYFSSISTPANETCQPSLSQCETSNYTVNALGDGIKNFEFTENQTFVAGSVGNIVFNGEYDQNYNITYTMDDDDATEKTLSTDPFTWMFDTPGYHKYTVKLNTGYFDDVMLKFSEMVNVDFAPDSFGESVKIWGPTSLEENEEGLWTFNSRSVSNGSLLIRITQNDILINDGEMNVTAGVSVWAVGMKSRDIKILGGTSVPSNGFFIIPDLTFETDGYLYQIEGDFKQVGSLNILILRPVCSSQEYCISTGSCCSTPDGLNLTESLTIPSKRGDWSNIPDQFIVVRSILVRISSPGHNTIDISYPSIAIKKGDLVGYHQTTTSAQFNTESTPSQYNIFQATGNPEENTRFYSSDITTKHYMKPKLRFYYSDFFGFEYRRRFTVAGSYKITSQYENGPIEKRWVTVQKSVGTLRIDNANPPPHVDINAQNLRFQVSVDYGTSLIYEFIITGPDEYNRTIKAGSNNYYQFTANEISELALGEYNLTARASNLISSTQKSTSFKLLEKITRQDLFVSNLTVYRNEEIQIDVTIHNGNEIDFEIDLGEGDVQTDFFPIANPTIKRTFTKSYSECGQKAITVKVKNPLSAGNTWENLPSPSVSKRNIVIICPLGDLQIETDPVFSASRVLEISGGVEVELKVDMRNGTFPEYLIEWGDGVSDNVDQTNKIVPEVFYKKHTYTGETTYYLTVTAIDKLQNEIKSDTVKIIVSTCSVPELFFSYGTPSEPLQYTRGQSIPMVGYWVKLPDCVDTVQREYKYMNATFKSNDGSTNDKIEFSFDLSLRKLSYTVQPRSYEPGSYTVNLIMSFKGELYQYSGYFRIVQSPLQAVISNNDFQTLPTRHKDGSFYNSVIDAKQSRDPDDPRLGYSGLNFTWFCRLKTENDTKVQIEIQKRNDTNVEYKCLNKVWNETQPFGKGVEAKSNAYHFLQNIEYEFRVIVQKGSRSSQDDQTVFFAEGDPPGIVLLCQDNCGSKINTQGELAYRLDCDRYPVWQQFSSKWIISYDGQPSSEHRVQERDGNCNNHNLIIYTDTPLVEAKNYTFEFQFRYYGDVGKSVYRITRQTSQIPHSGSCAVTGNNNITVDEFSDIQCQNWISEELPLSYELRYKLENGQDWILPGSSIFSRQLFTIGKREDNYKLNLRINIYSSVGQYRVEPVELYVRQTPPTVEVTADKLLDSVDTTDTQSVASLVNVFILSANVPKAGEGGGTESVENEANFGGVEIVNEDDLVAQQAKEAEVRKQATKLMSIMKSTVSNQTTFSGLAAVFTASNDFVSDKNVGEDNEALGLATDTNILASNNFIVKLSTPSQGGERLGPEQLEEYTEIALSSLSKSIDANAKGVNKATNVDSIGTATEQTDLERSEAAEKENEEKEKKKKNVQNLRETVRRLADAVGQQQVIGRKQTTIAGNNVRIGIKTMSSADDFANQQLSTDPDNPFATGVKMPPSFLNGSEFGGITVRAITDKNNVFPELNGTNNIGSEISTVSFASTNGSEIAIENSEQPFLHQIQNNPDSFQSTNVSLRFPGFAIIKAIQLDSVNCTLVMSIKALNDHDPITNLSLTNLTVLIQYNKAPSSNDYDVKIVLRNNNTEVTIGNQSPIFSANQSSLVTDVNGRSVFARKANDTSIVMWNFDQYAYASLSNNKTELYFQFNYEGPVADTYSQNNPFNFDEIEFAGAFNYSLTTLCASCRYANLTTNTWQEDGCEIIPERTRLSMTSCECNHFTSFGSFVVKPNPLKPLTLAALKDGYVLLVTVGSILLLYLVGLLFTRRADRDDSSKIGVCPLPDNRPEDRYLYEVTVNTGSRRRAGTTSNVYFTLSGDLGDTGVRVLKDPKRRTFQRSSSDVFVMTTAGSLGDLTYLKVWHDNKGGGWYLRSLEIIDLQTEERFVFIAGRWLSVDQSDGLLECSLPVAGAIELKDFNYIFSAKSRRDLSDAHIWFSIYARPPRSNFTRSQRLSVGVSLLFTAMVASCMFFGLGRGDPAEENRIGNFSFTWKQVYIAIISACITIPINVILVGLFRSIRPARVDLGESFTPSITSSHYKNEGYEGFDTDSEIYEMTENRIDSSSPSNEKLIKDGLRRQDSLHLTLSPNQTTITDKNSKTDPKKYEKSKKTKKREPFYLPHWVIYPAWCLNLIVIFGCAFIVVWYGISFGNKTSLDWLASVSIGLVQDILVIQPLKVFFVALFVALIVKKLDDEERSEIEKHVKTLAKNETWLHTSLEERDKTTIFDRIDTETAEPPNKEKLDRMRAARLKEIKMNAISREILLYLFFTCIVFILGFMTRDYRSFYQTRDLEELMLLKTRTDEDKSILKRYAPPFPFRKTHRHEHFWNWVEGFLLPELFPEKWFNISEEFNYDKNVFLFPNKLFLNDMNSKVVTGIRLRQVRVEKDSCIKAEEVRPFINIDCATGYSAARETRNDYNYNWSQPKTYKRSINPSDMPWRYQSWSDLDGYPMWAELDTYYGGGYVVELFPKWNNKANLENLKKRRWVDRHTRAVIVEFAIYNGNTNYFDSVNIIFEFPPGGGIVHYHSVITFKMYRYTDQYAFFMILCEVMFICFMIMFAIRESKVFYRTGMPYFKEFWNLVEFANIILSILAVFFNFYRDHLVKKLLSRLPRNERSPDKYINLQFAAYWDLVFTYIVALICFFVTLKFIKLLRFNRRISMLSSTLKRAWYPLMMFGICFGLVLASATMSATLIFGGNLYGYRSIGHSVSSIVSLLLGKFSYYQFESTNRVLGPVFFLSFNVFVNWIIMNMFISILNDVLIEVHTDVKLQNNDYEMVDYMLDSVKSWFGFSQSSKQKAVMQDAWEEDREEADNLANSLVKSSQMRMSRMSRRSRYSLRSQARSITSIKQEIKREARAKEKMYEYSSLQDYSAIYGGGNSRVFNTDLTFLMVEDENDDKFIDETLNKFVNCVSFLNNDEMGQTKPKSYK
ncbi:polycystin family receptor for egg jelly-like isoform X2 [Clytia hemisphaerica]|uniref:polycystin family receptor for egg jelly-like isoform X2 n=1 Tax=Clytia hemisphaerica TaxID=252671 RepID=UPI0034D5C4BD